MSVDYERLTRVPHALAPDPQTLPNCHISWSNHSTPALTPRSVFHQWPTVLGRKWPSCRSRCLEAECGHLHLIASGRMPHKHNIFNKLLGNKLFLYRKSLGYLSKCNEIMFFSFTMILMHFFTNQNLYRYQIYTKKNHLVICQNAMI